MAMELSMWTCRCGGATAEENHTDIPAISYHARTLYTYNTPHTCATPYYISTPGIHKGKGQINLVFSSLVREVGILASW